MPARKTRNGRSSATPGLTDPRRETRPSTFNELDRSDESLKARKMTRAGAKIAAKRTARRTGKR